MEVAEKREEKKISPMRSKKIGKIVLVVKSFFVVEYAGNGIRIPLDKKYSSVKVGDEFQLEE